MVITVEPGIYFNRYTFNTYFDNPAKAKYLNKDAIEPFFSFGGIRIEDDLLVTDDGVENLTTVPSGIDEIEAILAQNPNLSHPK